MADPGASRGATPVVGKALEATLVVLFVGLLSAVLYGGIVPGYQAAAGDELADRTVADVASDVERGVPPPTRSATVTVDVDLPATIDGAAYRIHAADDRLVLEHPHPDVGAEAPLSLPDRVVAVSGTLESGGSTTVGVTTTEEGLEVHLA